MRPMSSHCQTNKLSSLVCNVAKLAKFYQYVDKDAKMLPHTDVHLRASSFGKLYQFVSKCVCIGYVRPAVTHRAVNYKKTR